MNNKFYNLTFCHLRRIRFNLKLFLNSSPTILLQRFNSTGKFNSIRFDSIQFNSIRFNSIRFNSTGKFGRQKYNLSEERLEELKKKYGYEDRQFEDLTLDKFKCLIKDDETAKKIELIISEYEYEKFTTLRVPTTLTVDNVKLMLNENRANRKRRIHYLYQTEIAKINQLVARKQHSEEYWSKKNEEYFKRDEPRTGIFNNNGELIYGLWHNAIGSKISSSTTKRKYNSRLVTAAMFNQKFILDLGFDDDMEFYEIRHLCKQISGLYSYNKYQSEQPFDIHFCNVRTDKLFMQNLPKFLENYQNSMISFHEKSYLDLFPKENLIYLSPDAQVPLMNYNCDDIYIVGGIVDRSNKTQKRLTYIKAKDEGIRTARLPINEYIMWKSGHKELCVNHVFQILNHWAMTWDMEYSLKKNIPERNQRNEEEIAELEARRFDKYKKQIQLNNKNTKLKKHKLKIDEII